MAGPSQKLLRWDAAGRPHMGAGQDWYALPFAAPHWKTGPGPFGFGYAGLGTDVGPMMKDRTPSLYLRREFVWDDAGAGGVQPLRLRVAYDDGFVAYLNGKEIARRNLGAPGMFVYAQQPAFNKRTDPAEEIISLPVTTSDLVGGTNVLAIQVHNTWPLDEIFHAPLPADATLRMSAWLEVEQSAAPAVPLVQPTEAWNYFIGVVEPSGGLLDPALLEDDWTQAGFHDWIELYNPGPDDVSLLGWRLSDNPDNEDKWIFPDVPLPAGGYVVVFCSGLDRRDPARGALHTNFRLDARGEYIGLRNAAGEMVSEWAQAFPAIPAFYSWGRDAISGAPVYFSEPTPGKPNAGPSLAAMVDEVRFSLPAGFYAGDQEVALSCDTRETAIRYTLDGTRPTEANGVDYAGPVRLTSSATLRARAFRPGWIPSAVATASYLLNEPAEVQSMPALHLSADPGRSWFAPYGVLTIAGGSFLNEDYWVAETPADYNMAIMKGASFERPVFVELFPASSAEGVSERIAGGMRFSGSRWSRPRMRLLGVEEGPWNSNWPSKPSLSLFFNDDYGQESWRAGVFGDARVAEFESLRLRAGKNDWLNPFIRDEAVRRLHRAMGHVSSHGELVNLYVNGEYKSHYNLVERLREPFFQAWYDSKNQWDVITVDEVADGDAVRWTEDMEFIRTHNLADPANYAEAAARFDLENVADYLVLNIYCAMWDWPRNNFYVARERRDGAKWRFYVWDAEGSFGLFTSKTVDYDTISEDLEKTLPPSAWPFQVIPSLFRALTQNPEFRLYFADRVQKHLFGDGALSPEHVLAAYDELKDQLDPTITLKTGVPVHRSHMTNWVVNRPLVMMEDLAEANLWPATLAPDFSLAAGNVDFGAPLVLSNPNAEGTVYYTIDGTDPRSVTGEPIGEEALEPILLGGVTVVKARVWNQGVWSPLMEATYQSPTPTGLIISEINYQPTDFNGQPGRLFEFVEIQNTTSNRVRMAGVALTEGVNFAFPPTADLSPGEFAVIVTDAAAFQSRYPGVPVAGVFASGQLDNQGERLTLSFAATQTLFSVRYGDNLPWPSAAAGHGATLVPASAGGLDPDDYRFWRASAMAGGSPGAADPILDIVPVVINELLPRADAAGGWRLELFNPHSRPVNVAGWYLSDDKGNPFKYRIPDDTVLGAQGYWVLSDADLAGVPPANQVAINAKGGEIWLFSGDGSGGLSGYDTAVAYDASTMGVSFGRYIDSQGGVHYPPQALVTLGAANAGPSIGPIVINEVMYDPASGNLEFVELVNTSLNPVALFDKNQPQLTWRFNGLGFSFPEAIELLPGEMLVVTSGNPQFFRTLYDVPSEVRVLGPWTGNLQDGGERIQLQRPELLAGGDVIHIAVDEVRYDDEAPWPAAAAGGGASLQRKAPSAFGNDPSSWVTDGRTPGRGNLHRPNLVLTSPAYGDWATVGSTVAMNARVDGAEELLRVEFFVDAAKIGEDPSVPFAVPWVPQQPGSYELRAVGVLGGGVSATSAVVRLQVLSEGGYEIPVVASNSVWKFLDQGLDLGTTWRGLEYDDVTWWEGPAELGYGDDIPEATPVGYGPDPNDKYVTTYFRRTFWADPAIIYSEGHLRLLADDGAKVYLNGASVAHYNLPPDPIQFSTFALADAPENVWQNYNVPRAAFRAGLNQLAVEVHQVHPASEDLSFALELRGLQSVVEPWITRQPRSQAAEAGQDVVLDVESAAAHAVYQWYRAGAGAIPGANGSTLTLPDVQLEQAGDYYAVVSNEMGATTSLVATVTVSLPDLTDLVVINEIMYHPSSERTDEEFIELLNLHVDAVSLSGWRLTKGVAYSFPIVSVPSGGFLVVAANVAAFQAKYPGVTNVVGGWTGRLSNSDERLELTDSLGRVIDTVRYADRGDWATRRRGPIDYGSRGWEWSAPHDGLGSSLELRNPRAFNDSGQNWTASAVPQGTPGGPNSAEVANVAPLILSVRHAPDVPSSTNAVRISARILDETFVNFAVELYYRDHSSLAPPAFAALEMVDDGQQGDLEAGDGLYTALIPPQADGTVMEYYVRAVDALGQARTWPAPALNENGLTVQAANALYQVDDSVYAGTQPVLRVVMTETERQELRDINRSSNAEMNATLVSVDGVDSSVRYNTGVRIRGASSRYLPVPSLRVNIPSDRRWKGVTAINVNAYFAHDQVMGGVLSAKAGVPAADARAVQLRVNGINPAQAGPPNFTDGSGFGSFALLEVVDGDWADHHFPNNAGGNVYLGRRPNTDLAYLGTNWTSYVSVGYSKNSNQSENDWSDLIRLTDVLNNAPDETYVEEVREVLDPEAWLRYFALNTMAGNNESSLANGQGDDYDLYRGATDPRFIVVAHDWDTILGQAGALPANTGLFLATALPAINRFLKHPEFVPGYYAELMRLLNTVCSPAQLHPLLDQFLGDYADEGTLNAMKAYVTARADYVRSQIPVTLTVQSALPVVSGIPRSTQPTTTLWGQANVIETRSVRVNGAPAIWSAWEGRWTNTTVTLSPGLNFVLVESLDENGVVRGEARFDIWYDDGSQISVNGGVLNADTVWNAAAGPYFLRGNLEIPAGRTLTIEAGTTVYGASGTAFLVRGGRIVAEGNETQLIRFSGVPDSTATWKGLVFYDSLSDNVVRHAIIEDTGSYPVELRDSRLHLENVVFKSAYGSIYSTNSALLARHCTFPTMLGYETIYGLGMRPDGYFTLEENTFGGTVGYSDIIDFTGGKRPGPIIQAYGNVFLAGSDDGFDMDGTDAHLEGNTFMHFHRDAPRESISCGIATDFSAEIVAVRNVFYDCDNAVLLKRDAHLLAVNNTFVGGTETVVDFGSTNRVILPGRGAVFEGNISWGNVSTFERYYEPGYSDVDLTVRQSIIQGTNWPGPGNLDVDPLFLNASNDFRLRAGSPAIGTGPNGLDMGAFVPSGASISGEPPALSPQTGAILTVGGPGITHYRYRVNEGAYSSEELPVSEPLILSDLSDGTYRVSVLGKNSAGRWQDTNAPAISQSWTVNTSLPRVVLNEVLARNLGVLNHEGTLPDMIEIYNAGAGSYDLSGLRLTDDPLQPDKFVFPPGVSLGQGQYLVLFADAPNGTSGWHLGFSLQGSGESVYLFDRVSQGGALLDSVTFGLQLPDRSVGRMRDGQWVLTQPTPGTANVALPVGAPTLLRMTEWLANGPDDDFIELYNPLPVPVALAGLFLTDHPTGWPDRHEIPPLSFAAALSYVAFRADGNTDAGADHLNFSLAHEQGAIALFDTDLTLLDIVVYGPQSFGQSSGRLAPDDEAIVRFDAPSPGAANSVNHPPEVYLVQPVDGQTIPLPGNVTLVAEAFDDDGQVVKVEFFADGVLLGEDAIAPYSLVWSNAPFGAHYFSARATDDLGASTVSAQVTINGNAGTVTMTSPGNGFVAPIGVSISLEATVAGVLSPVNRVEFYAGLVPLGQDTSSPYAITWSSPNPGPYTLEAVAVTEAGQRIHSLPLDIRLLAAMPGVRETLIASNATWKYLDTGTDLGTDWWPVSFDDEAWKEGAAELGYGDGGEATVIGFGPNASAKYITTYFRRRFVVEDAASWANLGINMLIDDGAVVYLNNREVQRQNMPTGPVSFNTFAFNGAEIWTPFMLTNATLVPGTNQLAVEVHQVQPASSDLSFALELTAEHLTVEPWILAHPEPLTVIAGDDARFDVQVAGSPLHIQWYRGNGEPIAGADDEQLLLVNVDPHDAIGYYAVVTNQLGSVTSTTAQLSVQTPDSDGDGIPDFWEDRYGLDSGDPVDAGLDPDGDGLTSLSEYRKDTHPTQPNLFLLIEPLVEGSVFTGMRLSFRAEAQTSYVILGSQSLLPNDWETVASVEAVAASGIVAVTVPVSGTHRFYQVQEAINP